MSNAQRGKSGQNHVATKRKIQWRDKSNKTKRVKVRYLAAILMLAITVLMPRAIVQAVACPDVRIIFARGSGGEQYTDANYLEFKSTLESKLRATSISYDFVDLDYPAVGIGIDRLDVSLGALFGSGDAYEFGKSVKTGAKNLANTINGASCPNTKYAVGGYSQGAMVVSRALHSISTDRLIYAATFGDPKLYLPEGAGLMPAACRGENLSDYRMYVPDCQAYKGLLGAYIPYEPDALIGKVGTWCNKRDIFCSSHMSVTDHVSYISDNLYEDASRVIFDKITKTFGVANRVTSPHDTAILIDSTGSMKSMISKYKAEALRLATETFNAGGRVALYDYRDLDDPYQPVQHCDFDTCTPESFQAGLNNIGTENGGDDPESLLSASMRVMTDLRWKYGATKSLVVLTDANFLSPDRDGVTFDEVVALSKRIDPVNFYIVTTNGHADDYAALASATDGKVVTNLDELSLLTDYIMERYDSLPRVEESTPTPRPTIEITSTEYPSSTQAKISFTTTGTRTMVVLNDAILGTAEDTEIIITDLDRAVDNTISLIPLGDDIRGEAVEVNIPALAYGSSEFVLPKAPNSGRK